MSERAIGGFWNWLNHLDLILRGQATSPARLREGRFNIPVFGLAIVIDALGLAYGACMGLFAVGRGSFLQIPASMLKVPALFLLTLIVTLPSLYVFNALVGSRLTIASVVRLLVAALAVMLAVLASLGPIVGFFAVCTTSYSFIVLLNVVVYTIAGLLGLKFLLQTLHRMTIARTDLRSIHLLSMDLPSSEQAQTPLAPPPPPPPPPSGGTAAAERQPDEDLGPLDATPDHVLGPHTRTVFRIWVLVFGLVGTQMAWILRPFIGDPHLPFQWFRERQGNFFEAVAAACSHLF